jgi:hypothetical protein
MSWCCLRPAASWCSATLLYLYSALLMLPGRHCCAGDLGRSACAVQGCFLYDVAGIVAPQYLCF